MKTLPCFSLVPTPADEAARASKGFAWADQSVGRRHQLGGTPTHIQGEYVPNCAACETPMTFYAQLDSIDDEHCVADVGLIHVWLCFACFEAKAVVDT